MNIPSLPKTGEDITHQSPPEYDDEYISYRKQQRLDSRNWQKMFSFLNKPVQWTVVVYPCRKEVKSHFFEGIYLGVFVGFIAGAGIGAAIILIYITYFLPRW